MGLIISIFNKVIIIYLTSYILYRNWSIWHPNNFDSKEVLEGYTDRVLVDADEINKEQQSHIKKKRNSAHYKSVDAVNAKIK